MIAIVDYGMGNLHSVQNAFETIGAQVCITRDPDTLRQSDGIVLPGVGSFGDCMENLVKYKLFDVLKELGQTQKPFLGICLGMQVLFEAGYENGWHKGLGFLKGNITEMVDPTLKIPHMGWNSLNVKHYDEFQGILDKEPYVYYVHSYYASEVEESTIYAYSTYGKFQIPGYVRKKNILGMQFHPEKSGTYGLTMLQTFKEMCK